MNEQIRKLLIDSAVNDKPVYYGQIMQLLGLTGGINEDHHVLSQTLADISKYEKAADRPLLSSIVTYSPATSRRPEKKGETHGNGFYELAEELGMGNKSKLKGEMFAFKEIVRCREYWRNKDHYDQFYELHSLVETASPAFFTQTEFTFLSQWAGKVYNKEDKTHVAAKTFIKDVLGTKTVYWSNQLVARLTGFETFNWRMWSQKGWDETEGGRIRVARFKPYTWARIYKTGDAYKDIFFTVGVDGLSKSLVYKLDYYFEQNSELSNSQKALCEQLIPDELRRREISLSELGQYTWKRLLDESFHFIDSNRELYDEILQSVWNDTVNVSKLKNRLIKRDVPAGAWDELPERTFSFQGVDIDWDHQDKIDADTGAIGEELVIEYEKKKLLDAGFPKYAAEVKKQKDGAGYDIFSRYPDGTEKKIEVKTTTGGFQTPFPISLTEIVFSSKHADCFVLYRLYNLNKDQRLAEFYECTGDLSSHFLLESTHFRAYRKKK